jgi:glycosyltransferase involved in cell wall biosynthesis
MYAKVSVLLPVRNAASTLGEAVESLLRQTLQDLEIIAVEDGSDDESLAILRGLAETDNRLQVFDQKAQGIVMALNFAAQQATAPLLARMDADDICEPERLALQLAVMEREPDLAALGSSVVGFGQVGEGWQRYLDWLNGLKDSEAVHRNLYVESPLAHPSVMMRRTAFEGVGGYREFDGPEDYDLWLRLVEAGGRLSTVAKPLLRWRDHGERLTRKNGRYRKDAFLQLKVEHLSRGPLAAGDRPLIIWGAGRYGKLVGRGLQALGVKITAYLDIDPRKIGRQRRGVDILDPGALAGFENPLILAAVPVWEAREEIRQRLNAWDYREGVDYWAVA